jgi:restriction system protein
LYSQNWELQVFYASNGHITLGLSRLRYWAVRLGERGKYVQIGKIGTFVAIGWNELGDLRWFAESRYDDEALEKLSESYAQAYLVDSNTKVSINSGQIARFVKEISVGDIVLVPDPPRRMVLLGRVLGDYDYRDDWKDDCPYSRRRKTEWMREISRDELPQRLKDSLGAHLTVFNLDRHSEPIQELLTGRAELKAKREVTGEELRRSVIEKLMELDPKKFQEFTSHVLGILGFEAGTSRYVGDRNIDIAGELSVEGLTTVSLRVQVKRWTGSVGIEEVQRIRGTLGPDDHGALITTSTFTKAAWDDAYDEKKKQVALIDGEALVDLILKHYDELDEDYRNLLPLKRKELALTDRYTMTVE